MRPRRGVLRPLYELLERLEGPYEVHNGRINGRTDLSVSVNYVWNYREAEPTDLTFFAQTIGTTQAGAIITDDPSQLVYSNDAPIIIHPRPRWAISKIAQAFVDDPPVPIIGERFQQGSYCTIGNPGFGYEWDEDYGYFKMPHLGLVVIGDDVEVGSNICIDRGTFSNTTIGNGTKIDNLIHIAHNCQIGDNVIMAAGVKLSGSVTIGDRVWMGTNSTVMQGVTIGDGATIGIGAVVLRDVEPGQTVVGHHRVIETKEIQLGVIR